MALSFDGVNRIISITTDTVLDVRNLWSRWMDWYLTSDNSKFGIAMANVGGDDIDTASGTKIPIYVFLQDGWKVRPQEASHTLSVTNGILLADDGSDPFTDTLGTFTIRILNQQPVQAISFATGGGGGGGATASEIWNHGSRTLTSAGVAAVQAGLATKADLDAAEDAITKDTKLIPATL
ncbi:MAG: hypothetical protein ACRC5T_03545 [Cetobacterium sp.]